MHHCQVRAQPSPLPQSAPGISPNERFVVDESGPCLDVLVDVAIHHRLIEEWEEVKVPPADEEAKASGNDAIPYEEAVAEIEQSARCATVFNSTTWLNRNQEEIANGNKTALLQQTSL